MELLPFRLGYATSGFAHHRLEDAILVLAKCGYRALSLTLDVHHLNPFEPGLASRVGGLSRALRALDFKVVVETGARFLLDPERKHEPTLLSQEGADQREAFLRSSVAIARDLGADCVSFWSGARPPELDEYEARRRLDERVRRVIDAAEAAEVDLAFEPEPGMFIETTAEWAALDFRLGSPKRFGLALDVGHVLATGEGEPAEILRRHAGRLTTVAVEDMRRGVHDHLMFGDGHLDLPSVVDALEDSGYGRIVSIELPRHSHDAARIARRCADLFGALGADLRPR